MVTCPWVPLAGDALRAPYFLPLLPKFCMTPYTILLECFASIKHMRTLMNSQR